MPAPFDAPGDVTDRAGALPVHGRFLPVLPVGRRAQAEALGVDLRVFDSRQDAALQADMVDQAIALGVDGIIIQHGLTESMKEAAQRAVEAGINVVAFDVNVENDAIPQIEQDDYQLAKLALDKAIEDNGTDFTAGYVYVPGIAPLDRRDRAWQDVKDANPGINQVAQFGTLDNPIANSVANQARSVLQANPMIDVMVAPYDAFAKGVKIAVDEAGLSQDIDIYSADVSTVRHRGDARAGFGMGRDRGHQSGRRGRGFGAHAGDDAGRRGNREQRDRAADADHAGLPQRE